MNKLWLIVVMACLAGIAAAAPAVIYVDQANTNGPWDGSAANPFQLITNALDALALSNAVERGGHTVSVASGTYTELVYICSNFHAGTPSAPNMLLGVGNPVIDAKSVRPYGIHIQMATNFIVKGFRVTGAFSGWHGGQGIRLNSNNQSGYTQNWKIDSCYVYNNDGHGLVADTYVTGTVLTNCAFFLNQGSAVSFGQYNDAQINQCVFLCNWQGVSRAINGALVWIQNSVFAGNSSSAASSSSALIRMNSCGFYENGGLIYDAGANGQIDSVAELSRLGYGTNSIAADPCFAAISGFDFSKVYEGSPCIGGGMGGANIGLASLTTAPLSSNTYYVNTNGSDGYTKEQAQNPATPWKTIQAGVSRSMAGDTLKIAAGTYTESVVITNSGTSGNPLSLIADKNVVIDGTTNAIYLYRTAGILLDGLEVISCTTVGVDVQEIYGCRLMNLNVHCGTAYGTIIRSKTGRNYFSRCVYSGHTTAGVSINELYCGQNFESCNFSNNAWGVEMLWPISVSRFYNCNFNYNSKAGIRQYVGASFLKNCNVAGNSIYGIESWYAGGRPFAENCNFTGNGKYGAWENSLGKTYFTNCNFYANVEGLMYDSATATVITTIGALNALSRNTANIATDPMFCDIAGGNFRLKQGSGCIDKGTVTTELILDYYGKRRLVGPAVDIGVYEMPSAGTIFTVY